MEGLILAEYLILVYFFIMCLLILGVAAIRALSCTNSFGLKNKDDGVCKQFNSTGPSVYNLPWLHQSNVCTDNPKHINLEAVPNVPIFPESTDPHLFTPKHNGCESTSSRSFTPIYASPYALPRTIMSQDPVYVSLNSLGLRPKTPIYASPQFPGSRCFKPMISQIPIYASPSFVGPRYSEPAPGIHYKVPHNLYNKPVQMPLCTHPRIAALKAQSSVARSMSPCRLTVNGDLYAQVTRKNLHQGMSQSYRPKQQLIYTF